MLSLRSIHSLTDFQRRTRELIRQMEESGDALVLTVNGKAKLVVQDAGAYEEMLERLERAEAAAALRRGIEEFDRGQGRSAQEGFETLRQKHDIPR
jgi:prevent-host-death family protein